MEARKLAYFINGDVVSLTVAEVGERCPGVPRWTLRKRIARARRKIYGPIPLATLIRPLRVWRDNGGVCVEDPYVLRKDLVRAQTEQRREAQLNTVYEIVLDDGTPREASLRDMLKAWPDMPLALLVGRLSTGERNVCFLRVAAPEDVMVPEHPAPDPKRIAVLKREIKAIRKVPAVQVPGITKDSEYPDEDGLTIADVAQARFSDATEARSKDRDWEYGPADDAEYARILAGLIEAFPAR